MGFWVLARPCHTLESESVVEAICTEGSMPAPADARSSTLLQLQLLSYAGTTPAYHPHYTCGLFYGLMVQIMPATLSRSYDGSNEGVRVRAGAGCNFMAAI